MGYTEDGIPFAPASSTSQQAAHKQTEIKVSGNTARVLQFVKARGLHGATCDEMVDALKIPLQTLAARVNQMVTDGDLVRTTAQRVTRNGAKASVLVDRSVEDYVTRVPHGPNERRLRIRDLQRQVDEQTSVIALQVQLIARLRAELDETRAAGWEI